MKKFLVIGPSGVGKTTALTQMRERQLPVFGLDGDIFGFRTREQGWKSWEIDHSVFEVAPRLARNWEFEYCVVACCDSYADELIAAAQGKDFKVYVLICSKRELAVRRRLRGDKPDKVATAPKDVQAFEAIAERHGLQHISSFREIPELGAVWNARRSNSRGD